MLQRSQAHTSRLLSPGFAKTDECPPRRYVPAFDAGFLMPDVI